jgi:hypothetical protein
VYLIKIALFMFVGIDGLFEAHRVHPIEKLVSFCTHMHEVSDQNHKVVIVLAILLFTL